MNDPLISIIVPIYNVEAYLSSCLDSLINQTYQNIEIIAVNDGSTDNSPHILKEYVRKDKRIKAFHQENCGLSEARNTGVYYATGEYICFVDSDDWLDLHCLEKAVNAVKNAPGTLDLVLWGYYKSFANKNVPVCLAEKEDFYDEHRIERLYQRIIGPVGKQLRTPHLIDSYGTAWGKLFRSSIIKYNHIEFISTKHIGTEDLFFAVEFFQFAKSAVILPECLNYYRKSVSTSLTATYKKRLFQQWTELQNLVWSTIKGNPLFEEAFYNRVVCSMIGLGLNEYLAPVSYNEKINHIRDILETDRYKEAFSKLKVTGMPLHWKLFFLSCKYRSVRVYFLLISIIHHIIK